MLSDNEIALRPKTFAVLRYLVENCGRLVSKEELFRAVWPNVAVTDDTLVQSIGELRRAIRDHGAKIIKTIPRRGYRFEGEVTDATASGKAAVRPALPAAQPDQTLTGPASGRRALRTGLLAACAAMVALLGYVVWPGSPIGTGSGLSSEIISWIRPGIRAPDAVAKPAIAILPFLNQSNDPAREYFAEGMTQDLITALGRFSDLTVMSWNAVSNFRRASASPGEIARRLNVRYQVEGSVAQAGERVRIAAQLVASDGRVLWSARLEEPYSDLLVLQDKITAEVAGALAIRVTEIERGRVLTKPSLSPAAYDYVLRARPALQRPVRADLVQARVLLRRAIELDPNYAEAYAALAEAYFTSTSMGWAELPSETVNRAEELANKALALDDSNVRAHTILGRIHIFFQRYEQARAEIDRAVSLNPSDAHALAGRGNNRMWLGESDAAIADLELALRIDPELAAMDRFALSLAYYLKGRYDAAVEQAELNLQRTDGANFTRIVLAAAYAELNNTMEAERAVTAIHRLDPTFDVESFGSKLLRPDDLAHLRDGMRKAGLYSEAAGQRSEP